MPGPGGRRGHRPRGRDRARATGHRAARRRHRVRRPRRPEQRRDRARRVRTCSSCPTATPSSAATRFQTATAMGGLPYLTPLRITWGNHSAIAYKRDIGLGGGPIDGLPRVLDLWWELAGRLGIPYEDGLWSGPVQIERPPPAGAGNVLGQSAVSTSDASADRTAGRGAGPGRVRAGGCADRRRRSPAPIAPSCSRTASPPRRRTRRSRSGNHRRRQPDRRQAVRVRRRARAAAVRDRARLRLLEQRRAPSVRRRPAAGRPTTRRRARSSPSGRPDPAGGSRSTRAPTTCSCTWPACAGTRTTRRARVTAAPGSAGIR